MGIMEMESRNALVATMAAYSRRAMVKTLRIGLPRKFGTGSGDVDKDIV